MTLQQTEVDEKSELIILPPKRTFGFSPSPFSFTKTDQKFMTSFFQVLFGVKVIEKIQKCEPKFKQSKIFFLLCL